MLALLITGVMLLLGALAALGFVASERIEASRDREARAGQAQLRNSHVWITYSQNLSFDPRNKEALSKNSQEVFAGRVERLTGREDNHPTPLLEGWAAGAQFRVGVLEVYTDRSGDLPRRGHTVTVNQLGVPPPGTRARVELANEYRHHKIPARMLRVGRDYVFVTGHEESDGRFTTRVDPFGWMCPGRRVSAGEAPFLRTLVPVSPTISTVLAASSICLLQA